MKKIKVLLIDAFFVAAFEYLFHKIELFEKIELWLKQYSIHLPKFSFLGWTITVSNLIIILVLAVTGYFIISRFFVKGNRVTRKQNEIKKLNSKDVGDIRFQYDVEFDPDGKLYIDNLTPYCTKHGSTPIKMVNNYFAEKITCSIPSCPTKIDDPKYETAGPMKRMSNIITSELEQKWRDMNK